MIETDIKMFSIVAGLIIAAWGWFIKHITNSKKHPCKSDVVYKDVCEVKSKAIEDCIEQEICRSAERHKELKEDMRHGFDRIEDLIKNGSGRKTT